MYNGEVYNYRELRAQLVKCGHSFRTTSDTEVLVHGYEEWGASLLERIRGMFAFALWDANTRCLLLVRDHLGVKPLYYAPLRTGGIAFASELKALLGIPGVDTGLDPLALAKYLSFLWVPHPATPFAGIRKLEPATFGIFERGEWKQQVYWDLTRPPATGDETDSDPTERIDALIQESVLERLVADVPVGVYLSGGIDSSIVTAMAIQNSAQPVQTATVTFPKTDLLNDPLGSDLEFARLVRDHFNDGVKHREILVEADAADTLQQLTWHCDDPVADPAIIPAHLIAKAVRPDAPVMLSGVGAEEVFAGYPRHLGSLLSAKLDRLPRALKVPVRTLSRCIPVPRDALFFRHARRLIKGLKGLPLDEPQRFLSYRTYYNPSELSKLLGDHFSPSALLEDHLRYWTTTSPEHSLLNRLLYLDLKTYLPCLNLAYIDRASMAASVEVREPLLDIRLLEAVWSLPDYWKIDNRRQKVILKAIGSRYLPRAIVDRQKVGFGSPVRSWLSGPLRHLTESTLSPESLRAHGVLDTAEVQRILSNTHHEDWALRVWALLNFQLWADNILM